MVFALLLYFVRTLARDMFTCYDTQCPDYWLGDGYCDSVCMNYGCDFDAAFVGSSNYETFLNSDCFGSCGCNETLLTNGVCDSECNSYQCGWDLGDCGYCASGCFESNLTGSDSDPKCKTIECLYGNDFYGWCNEGCFYDDIYGDTCKSECNSTYYCLKSNGNPCLTSLCAPGCTDDLKENDDCDNECNNADCNYDNGGCYCDKDCPSKEGNCTTNGSIKDPCDIQECGFKDGKCGYCASGCFYENLGDGKCQSACNNENCNYDNGDCGCSYNCSYIYDPTTSTFVQIGTSEECSIYCLVPDCNFAVDFCGNNETLIKGVLNALVNEDTGEYLNLSDCDCPSGNISSYINETMTCEETFNCSSKECLYCMGRAEEAKDSCVRQNFDECLICSTTMIGGTCKKDVSSCPYGYDKKTMLSDLFGINLWCVREPTRYSKSTYKEVYVDTSLDDNGETGEADDPYNSLYYAFLRIYATYTKIFLKNEEVEFVYDKSTSDFISDKLDPLNSDSIYGTNELWIIGDYSSSVKTKVIFQGNLKITPLAEKVYIKNIEFIGSFVLNTACTKETCYYCPYLTILRDSYFNDRNERIDSDIVASSYSTTCSSYSTVNVFKFTTEVYIEDVNFVGFRYQYNSFISSSKILSLKNVNFSKMQAKSTGSIILLSCTTDCIKSNFIYEGGEVSDLGYGYDDSEYVATGSFIISSGIGDISIQNVKFTYNFLFINKQNSNFGYLLYSTNHLGTIYFYNCDFSNNYVNYLIYIDVTTLVYSDYRYSEGISYSYYQQHFQMNNIVINNTYCSEGLVYYIMKKVVQNINIKNLSITNSVIGDSGIFQFINQATLTDSDVNGTTIKKPIDGEQTKIFIPPRNLYLENVNIKDSYIGYCAVYINKYPNANFLNISITDISDGTVENIKDIINYFNESGRYLAKIDEENELPELNCNEMVFISNNANLNINTLTISTISCLKEVVPSGISLQKITVKADIRELTLSNMESEVSSGLAFTAFNSLNINITGLYVQNMTNNDESILYFDSCVTLTMDTVTVEDVESKYAGSIIVSKSNVFTLSNFEFNSLVSTYGNGGCLYLRTGIHGSKYSIKSGVLTSCAADSGNGGALCLEGVTTASFTQIETDDLKIINSSASEGSAIYVSSIINLGDETPNNMAGIVIEEGKSGEGGVIVDYHFNGTLIFDGLQMDNNYGIYPGIYSFYSSSSSELQILNSNFNNSESEDSLFYFRCLKDQASISFENVYIENSDYVTIQAFSVNIKAKNMSIINVWGGVELNSKTNFEGNEIIFDNSENEVITINSNSFFECINCIFENNQNSIIVSKASSSIYLENTDFFNNTNYENDYYITVTDSNADLSLKYDMGYTTLNNCKMYSNYLDSGNFIYASSASVTINSTEIQNNDFYSSDTHLMYMSNVILEIYNSTFQLDLLVENGAFIYAVSKSIIVIDGSKFKDSGSVLGNIYGISVTITIKNCEFLSNSGGDIYVTTSKLEIYDTIFNNSIFTQSENGVVSMISSNSTLIDGCSFTGVTVSEDLDQGSYIYDSSSKKLVVTNTEMTGSSNIIGLNINKCSSISLKNLVAKNFHPEKTSAITIKADSKGYSLSIKDSKITESSSTNNGGGLYIENYNVTIEDTEISFNSAEGSGGGIYYTAAKCDNCGIYIKGDTEIFNNTCKADGGGIKWEDFKPSIEKNDLIYNNSAVYGSELATVPAKFGYFENSRRLKDTIVASITDFGPGKIFTDSIEIYILDTYGEVVKTQNSLVALLSVNESSSKTSSVSGTTKFTAQEGVLNLTNFIVSGQPGTSMYLKISSEDIKSTGARNDDTIYINTALINITFRECKNGEQIVLLTGCVDCPANKYTIKPSTDCKSCPTGASCLGADVIIVDDGYWRSSLESDVVYECEIFGACLQGNETDELGSCSAGYSGILCQSCEIGYSKSGDGKCGKCPEQAANIVILIILSFCIVFVSVVLVKTTLKSAFSPKALHSIYIKIFTNYLQLVFIVTQFKLEWPAYVIQLFNIQKSAATVSDQIFSVDCYLAQKNANDSSEGYYIKLCLVAGIPIFIFLVAYIYWISHGSVYQSYKYLKREVFTTIIVLFFLVYPNIVKLLFSNFSCVSIDQMDSYLKDNTAIQCWDSRHKRYSFIVAIPGIIIWAIGLPTLLLLFMWKNKRRLHLDHYRVIFGFLYNGFRQSRFFWEFIIMYRKIFLISIAVFMASEALILQALNVVIVLFFSFYLQYAFKPYNYLELNHMEMQALAVASVTIYCGLYYLSKSIGDGIKMVLFISIVFGNSYFILFWIYYMLQALVDMFIKFFPQFKLICKRGDAFEEEFNTEEIVQEGVFYNPLEGAKAYTFFEKESRVEAKKMIYRSMDDAYKDVIKREINRLEENEGDEFQEDSILQLKT